MTTTTYDLPESTKPTTVESVTFHDGMIVTADDLDAAMRYPVSLLHTALRALLGCGVVCGLGLRVRNPKVEPRWVLCVDRGVALDCHGHPIELCAPVELDLSPEACACESPPEKVCIAVRRVTSDEAPHDPCGCDTDQPRFDCRRVRVRVRDHVQVKAFTEPELDALPSLCRWTDEDAKVPPCDALKACTSCACGDSWILLGCVTLDKDKGIVGEPDVGGRRWVKPVQALCPAPLDRVTALEQKVAELEKKQTPAAATTSP